MSAATTTVSGSTALANNTNTSATLSKVKTLQKMAAEEDSKRVANVTTQKRKLEVANKKAAVELSFKGKNAILKDKPSRPVRRPVKKNRKQLPPPSNKEHDTRTATAATRAVIKTKEQLTALSIVRPSLNFDQIVEQRVVNGVVERIHRPIISQPLSSTPTSVEEKSRFFHNYTNIIEQRVVNGVIERVHESVDAPQAAALDIDAESATKSDNDTDRGVLQLVRGISTSEQLTDSSEDFVDYVEAAEEAPKSVKEAVSEVSFSCCPSAILSMPNASLYPPRLSRDEEAALVAMHVAPVEIPVTVSNQQKLTKAEKKAAKAAKVPKEVTTVKFEVPYLETLLKMPNGPGVTKDSRELHERLVVVHVAPLSLPVTVPKQQKASKTERKATNADRKMSVSGEDDEPDFVASLLSKPNGPGAIKEARDLHNNLVEMHVAPFELPLFLQQQKKIKKVKSADTLAHESFAVYTPVAGKKPIVADNHASVMADLNAGDFIHDEETLIEDIYELGPLAFIKVKDDPQQVDGQVADTIDKQTVVIPDDTTPVTPPASNHDPSSSGSDYLNSTKTSRRSSVESSAESIRRKAEKARTTFLGKISLEKFVNTLDFELCDGTTTKDDVCEAFASLADGPTTGLDSVKIQRKIKLGGTSLYGFLRQLDFDDDEVTVVGKVIKVFNKAAKNESSSSKLDVALWLAESSQGEGSR